MVSITTLLGSRFHVLIVQVPCPYSSLEKGLAKGGNDGRELAIFADTVSSTSWVEKYRFFFFGGGGGGGRRNRRKKPAGIRDSVPA